MEKQIAILGDIHGNLPALEAVLDDMPVVSQIWVLGDMVGELPFPCEVMDRLLNLDVPVHAVIGNREESLLIARNGGHKEWWEGNQYAALAWTSDTLKPPHWDFINSLQKTLYVDSPLGGALLYHGMPDDIRGAMLKEEDATKAIGAAKSIIAKKQKIQWLAGGHSHHARLFSLDDIRIIGAGSVGLALDGIGGVACYALINSDKRVTFRNVSYDTVAVIDKIRESGLSVRAPGIALATTAELLTGRHYMSGLVEFAEAYARRKLSNKSGHLSEIPLELWKQAEKAWDVSEWMEGRMR